VKWAFDFDTVALRFRKMSLKSVLFVAYDLYTEGMTSEIEDPPQIPGIYLYPAKSKSEDAIKFQSRKKSSESFDQNELIRFIDRNARIKINLPKSLGIKDPKQGPGGKTRGAVKSDL
jgi:hypothetical protein